MDAYDVIVVGGGPAGMMAAGHAAEYGRRVLLLEKNERLGRKLELTGGGRCNITNAEFDNRAFLAAFGDAAKFLFSPFSRFAVQDTFDFFAERGLPLVVEERKRAFPETQCAADVTRVMLDYMREHEVEIRFGTVVHRVLEEEGRLVGVETSHGAFRAESIVLATGGSSYRETGSTGDGFKWLEQLGHHVHAASPDIVPLRVKEQWVKDLSGTNLESMRITFCGADGSRVVREGRLLFTHFGLSGPLILNSANEIKKLLRQGAVAGQIDLYPGVERPAVDRRVLEAFDANKNKLIRSVIRLLVPSGMGRAAAGHFADELLEKKVNVATQEDRRLIVDRLKALPLTVTGTMGYDWAVVCDGGVDMTEVDTRTMQSRRHPNLFIVGDLLHISRPSGGFSLQLCWTSGFVAGEHA